MMNGNETNSNRADRLLRNVSAVFLSAVLVLTLALMVLHDSFGWIATVEAVFNRGMNAGIDDGKFELRVDDGTLGYSDLYTFLGSLFSSFAGLTTDGDDPDDGTIKWRIDGSSDSLAPGSQGELRFQILTNDVDVNTILFSFDIQCFSASVVEEDDVETVTGLSEITETSGHTADEMNGADYLRTHLMFFRERTGNDEDDYQYSGLIDDISGFTLSPVQASAGVYNAVIYWVWPNTVGQVLLNSSVPADVSYLGSGSVISVLNATGETQDRERVKTYLKTHKVFYSGTSEDSMDYYSSLIDSLYTKRSAGTSFQSEFDTLSSGFNAADLLIGMNVNYITVSLVASRY